jgi:hypothetical protein
MVQFLKALRKLPVKEQLKDIAVFINRELLPFVGELQTSIDTTNEDNSDSFDDLAEPEYIVKSANATLVNERVADDSSEIDLDYTAPSIVSWFLKTASVAFSKLSNLDGLSVLGRATNSSGVMSAITATSAHQSIESSDNGLSIGWVNIEPADFDVFVSGTLTDYVLPAGIRPGDTVAFTITGDTTLNSIVPPYGVSRNFWFQLCLRNQSGGDFSLSIPDVGTFSAGRAFRTPGQLTIGGTGSTVYTYVMKSEEEAAIITYCATTGVEIWRVSSGTAAQAVSGDITIAAGKGGTRDSAITSNVIVNADINSAAAIALSKLATQAANTVVANATAGTAVPTAVAVGTNVVVGRVAGNIVAATLVDAQVSATAAIAISKLANAAALTVAGNATNGSAAHTDIAATAASGAVLRESGSTIGFGTVAAAGLASAIISPIKLAIETSNIAAIFSIRVTCAAGTPGSADDVTIYNANAPFAFLILDCHWLDSTAIALSTVQLRDTAGGGGAALSSALTAAATGTARNNDTQTRAVAANGSVFLRRSDRGAAGEIVIICIRT